MENPVMPVVEKSLDPTQKQKINYCIPIWLRDIQIKMAIERVRGRFQKVEEKRTEPVAVACFGPSLADEWEKLKDFKYIITCSGAHKFLVDRGIIPTWHIELDPRPHKIKLIGQPHKDVEYLIASTCHPELFAHLEGHNVKLWHIFDNTAEGLRILPRGEWALTGGCSVGLRALAIARFLGFTDLHIFGMDGSEGKTGKHAAAHPNQANFSQPCVYNGVTYRTTTAFLEAARQTFHELDQMKDVKATFYGEGLVQAMSKDYKPKHPASDPVLGIMRPELISAEMRDLNRQLHLVHPGYGIGSSKYANLVLDLMERCKIKSVLDYGSGKGQLAKALPFPIWEYDPAIPGKDESPRPAELVMCVDVLEHIEPDKLPLVLDDLRRCVLKVGYFTIHIGAAQKKYADGRNTHLIQKDESWWRAQISEFFSIGSIKKQITSTPKTAWDGKEHHELHFVVGPKGIIKRWDILSTLAVQGNWTDGVEVGVKEGRLFLKMLGWCPNLRLTGVDIFEARPGIESEGGESHADADLPGHEKRILDTIAKCYPNRGKLIKGYSVDAAKGFKDASLDFVFIDADHREECVRADIAAWKPKVKPGGMLMGHDAQEKFPGVLAAINDLCKGYTRYEDSVWGITC
jgi:uncharacterized Rossmann fold enzyme